MVLVEASSEAVIQPSNGSYLYPEFPDDIQRRFLGVVRVAVFLADEEEDGWGGAPVVVQRVEY